MLVYVNVTTIAVDSIGVDWPPRLLARKRGWHQDAWIVLAGASQAVM